MKGAYTMKRIVILLLSLTVLCACLPTPEEDAVKQKDTNVLIDTVLGQEESADGVLPTLSVPARFVCDFTTDTQNVNVIGDAPIEVLSDSGTFPVLHVEHRTLSDAERLTLTQRILGSEQLYIYEYHLTRSVLEAEIKNLMQEPSPEQKKEWMQDNAATEEEWQQALERRKAMLEEYQRQYNLLDSDATPEPLKPWDGAAPVDGGDRDYRYTYDIVRSATDTRDLYLLDHVSIDPLGSEYGIQYQGAWRDINDTTVAWAFDSSYKFGTERINPADFDKAHEGAAVTPYQAIATVQSIFDGVCNLKAADVYWANNAFADGDRTGINADTRFAYLLRMSEDFGGAYTPYCSSLSYESALSRDWRYESVLAVVDGDGKLLSLEWLQPYKTMETVSEAAQLLPYEEIESIFAKQVGRRFAEDYRRDGTLSVDRVQLGLFRIREQNNMESGLLVPAWFFTGTFTYSEAVQNQRKEDGFRNWERGWLDDGDPILIINAIDGSIIDPHLGY